MGRWSFGGKTEADNLKKIEVWWLKKNGYLNTGFRRSSIRWKQGFTGEESSIGFYISTNEDNMYLNLIYVITGQDGTKKKIDYKVPLTTTPCNYGNSRYWFICPLSNNGKYCGRRVGVLYMGGNYFACRHCYNLTYQSRNENRRGRNYSLYTLMKGLTEGEKLEAQIKTKSYAGKPTKKQLRLNKLYAGMLHHNTPLKERQALYKDKETYDTIIE